MTGIALAAVVAACGSRTVGSAPSPDEGPSVRVWREELEDNSNSTIIWAENLGTSPVVISQLRLYSCANLYQECGMHAPNVRIEPGRRERVARLDPSDHRQRPRFGYEYQWRGVRQQVAQVQTARTVISSGGVRMPVSPIEVEDWRALVAPVAVEGRCAPLPPLGGEGRMIRMQFGAANGPPVRQVSVGLDAGGRIVSVNDTRGDLRRAPPGVPERQVVSDPGPRTSIAINLLYGTALLTNQPETGDAEMHSANGDGLLDAPTLGPLRELAERVVRECGG